MSRLRRDNKTFVGFGFGAIQAGLFCHEAVMSRAFRHVVVAEIVPEVVAEVRAAGGFYRLNVAHPDHVEAVTVGPIQIENPDIDADRMRLVEAIAAAQEIATAVPTVQHYRRPGPGSLHRLLAQGLQRKIAEAGPVAVIYAAENHPKAAALLRAAVMEELPEAERSAVEHATSFVDTVIGKMSGVISPPADLAPLTPKSGRALLVEAFNKILVARAHFAATGASFSSGFPTLSAKEDLAPFEEAKFFGHNGIHAVGAYIGWAAGLTYIAEWATTPGMINFLRSALIDEVGAALIHRYAGVDTLFTPAAFAAYAGELLLRMVNPHLRDSIARVGREPERKLGWDDRMIGAMRVAQAAGVTPARYAFGVAAALHVLDPGAEPALLLPALWREAAPNANEATAILALVQKGVQQFKAWQAAGYPNLQLWWEQVARDEPA